VATVAELDDVFAEVDVDDVDPQAASTTPRLAKTPTVTTERTCKDLRMAPLLCPDNTGESASLPKGHGSGPIEA